MRARTLPVALILAAAGLASCAQPTSPAATSPAVPTPRGGEPTSAAGNAGATKARAGTAADSTRGTPQESRTSGRFVVHCDPLPRERHAGNGLEPARYDTFGKEPGSARPSTCSYPGDQSTYQVSALYLGQRKVTPQRIQAHYLVNSPSTALPAMGLTYRTDGRGSSARVAWTCTGTASRATRTGTCPDGEYLSAEISIPECWDGITQPHRRQLVPADPECPPTHPYRIPQLTLYAQWSCDVTCYPHERYNLDGRPLSALSAQVTFAFPPSSVVSDCRDRDCGLLRGP